MDTMDAGSFQDADALGELLSSAHRPLRLYLGLAAGATADLLMPHRVDGREAVCDGIDLCIDCLALDAHLPLKELIGVAAELQIVTDEGNLRSICGIVMEATQGESDGGLASYQLVLRDALALLDLAINTRVFLDQSELDVVRTILSEARTNNPLLATMFDFACDPALAQRQYPRRQQLIQCNESTGAFVRRLLRRRGIAWFFKPGNAQGDDGEEAATLKHTMLLFYDSRRLKQSPAGTLRYHRDAATEERDSITAWSGVRALRPGSVTRFSWDYATPRSSHFMRAGAGSGADQGVRGNRLAATLDQYLAEAPHVRDDYDDLCELARQHMARSDFESKCYYAEGGVRSCAAGEYFILDGHPDVDAHPDEEREFVVLAQHITAQNNLPNGYDARVDRLFARNRWSVDTADLGRSAGAWFEADQLRYRTRLTCVRRDIAFVPAYDPRIDLPRPALQSVIVAGPPGEEVHCDAQNRIKVRLLATRAPDHAHAEGAGASGSDRDSAWVRVLTPWAGAMQDGAFMGARFLPRAGTEGLVDFLGGDPDKPVFLGQLFNTLARSPQLGLGDLPGERHVSGIKSREIKGRRANQLRLDDTAGQISAQLASEHARSELNLGWLTQPRRQGVGKARGEGAELATDAQLALRAGRGMLLSAWQRLGDGGQQLDRADYLALMEDCVNLFRSLGQFAAQNQALPVDTQPQEDLQKSLTQWEQGSNTAPAGEGGSPAIAITAPAGISFATANNIVSYAATNIDTVAQQQLQLTAGQRFTVNAGKGVSLFAQQEGLNVIANYGKLLMQSQHDTTQIDAAKDVNISAKGRVIIMADEIMLVNSAGAYLSLKGGAPEIGGPGAMTIKTAGHHWNGAASQSAQLPTFGDGTFSRTPRLLHANDGKPVEGMDLRLERDGAGPETGTSDAAGEAGKTEADQLQQLTATFHRPRT